MLIEDTGYFIPQQIIDPQESSDPHKALPGFKCAVSAHALMQDCLCNMLGCKPNQYHLYCKYPHPRNK